MAANNGPFQVYPGQNYTGSDVLGAQVITAKKLITANGIAAGGAVPAITPLGNAGSAATITQQNGYDQAGNFVLTAGTASVVAGSLASVTFGQPLSASVVSVNVTAGGTAASAAVAMGATGLSKTGFTITGPALGTSVAWKVCYQVFRSPY